MCNFQNVLFDLDGTLTNPEEGIVNCFQYALQKMGRSSISRSVLSSYIGPPARIVFSNLIESNDEAKIEKAIEYYRERFSIKGMYENQVYSGISELLRLLKSNNTSIFVATSKPKIFAEKILKHFKISDYFNKIYGPQLNGRNENKIELVRELMEDNELDPLKTIIVGDRKFDIEAGKSNKISSCGVTYGFGSLDELLSAQPDKICSTVAELGDHLLNKEL